MTVSTVVNRCRSSPMHQAIGSITHALVIMISIAVMDGPVWGQSSSASSITAHEGSSDSQSMPVQHGPFDQGVTSPCSLRVPAIIPQPSGQDEGATPTHGPLAVTPLSARCKFKLFLTSTYSPYTFASTGFQATEAQATGQWPHYGGGTQGWAKRFGATLANTESRRFIQGFALSTILHQDPRYFPSPNRGLVSRTWYSVTRVVITKNDNGDGTFNTSELLGTLLTSALQNSYYPRPDRTFGDTMNRFGGALSSDVIEDLLREFTPDMKRLFRKHAPKKILKIEERLPIPAEDKP
jgi:hypothetical protein